MSALVYVKQSLIGDSKGESERWDNRYKVTTNNLRYMGNC